MPFSFGAHCLASLQIAGAIFLQQICYFRMFNRLFRSVQYFADLGTDHTCNPPCRGKVLCTASILKMATAQQQQLLKLLKAFSSQDSTSRKQAEKFYIEQFCPRNPRQVALDLLTIIKSPKPDGPQACPAKNYCYYGHTAFRCMFLRCTLVVAIEIFNANCD